ncbi:MAG: hypothetical protein BGO41_12725 [Clostridiales bacterium 38-18]|nr:MAG: hypothetical protein BGO41_12725 [Clostridiales bacterium 38-18]
MIFSSYSFLLFLVIVFAGYYALNYFEKKTLSKVWLVGASFYFYAQGSMRFLPFFVFTVFFNYFIGTGLVRAESVAKRRVLFALGLLENLALLGYFKYADFFLENVNFVLGKQITLIHLALPIGISFFTFQLIAYIVDCYRGETQEYSLINYLLFITFFPQLIVGPIIHHKDVVPQFENPSNQRFIKENIMLGLFVFAIGCTKKVMLADPLTHFAQSYFSNVHEGGLFMALFSSLSYTFSYYFDLSGYADMAIGLGLFFNINLPQNFDSPYKSRNFRDYWRRWHMSLSKFLSDYVFRSVYKKGSGSVRFYAAVMATFLVSGFWHGAGWRFVLWGGINGIFVCMAHFMTRRKWSLPTPIAWGLTFIGIVGTRIIFVSGSLKDAIHVMKTIVDLSVFNGWAKTAILAELGQFLIDNIYIMALLAVSMFIAFFFKNTREITEKFDSSYKYAFITGVLIVLSLFQMSNVADFLYFQF